MASVLRINPWASNLLKSKFLWIFASWLSPMVFSMLWTRSEIFPPITKFIAPLGSSTSLTEKPEKIPLHVAQIYRNWDLLKTKICLKLDLSVTVISELLGKKRVDWFTSEECDQIFYILAYCLISCMCESPTYFKTWKMA